MVNKVLKFVGRGFSILFSIIGWTIFLAFLTGIVSGLYYMGWYSFIFYGSCLAAIGIFMLDVDDRLFKIFGAIIMLIGFAITVYTSYNLVMIGF